MTSLKYQTVVSDPSYTKLYFYPYNQGVLLDTIAQQGNDGTCKLLYISGHFY